MTILERIVETKRREVADASVRVPLGRLQEAIDRADLPRDFQAAVARGATGEVRLIAEIKQASPSAGLIVADFDPVRIARVYRDHGAAALSVLTDETYFQGRLSFIADVKRVVDLPVLRKDFLIDEYQVYESRAAGADAILLIAECLDDRTLLTLARTARDLHLSILVEVHSEVNLSRVFSSLGYPSESGYLLGINNRDLTAQRTDLGTMGFLASRLPPGTPFVAESGIAARADVLAAQRAGACAVLVGESLLRARDIGLKVNQLLGAAPEGGPPP